MTENLSTISAMMPVDKCMCVNIFETKRNIKTSLVYFLLVIIVNFLSQSWHLSRNASGTQKFFPNVHFGDEILLLLSIEFIFCVLYFWGEFETQNSGCVSSVTVTPDNRNQEILEILQNFGDEILLLLSIEFIFCVLYFWREFETQNSGCVSSDSPPDRNPEILSQCPLWRRDSSVELLPHILNLSL